MTKPCTVCGAPMKRADNKTCSRRCAGTLRYGGIEARFWAKVDKRGPNECWPWLAVTDGRNRGSFTWNGRPTKAPRIAWFLTHGEMPQGETCHSCDNPICVNPAHLWVGTKADNMRDMVVKGRHARHGQTHCVNGHEYTPENTYWRPKSHHRDCRICVTERSRRRRRAA